MESRAEKNKKTKKIKRKKLNVARTLVLILFIYLIVCICIYIYKEPVKHYEIEGNSIVSDVEILRSLDLIDYPAYVSINKKKLEEKLEENVFIKKASISYSLDFSIKIKIEENKPIFIVKSTDEICLSDGTLIEYTNDYIGIPILLNTTPEKVMKTLAKNLSELDAGILYTINDIEYKPSYNSQNQVIDEYRFLLSMNDKNLVYINGKNTKTLSKYLDIIATNKITTNGTLYLDGDEDKYYFKMRETTEAVKEEETKKEDSEDEVDED